MSANIMFDLTDEQMQLREAMLKQMAGFSDDYWLAKDREGVFPEEFFRAVADGGWLGVATPVEYGGGRAGDNGSCVDDASDCRP